MQAERGSAARRTRGLSRVVLSLRPRAPPPPLAIFPAEASRLPWPRAASSHTGQTGPTPPCCWLHRRLADFREGRDFRAVGGTCEGPLCATSWRDAAAQGSVSSQVPPGGTLCSEQGQQGLLLLPQERPAGPCTEASACPAMEGPCWSRASRQHTWAQGPGEHAHRECAPGRGAYCPELTGNFYTACCFHSTPGLVPPCAVWGLCWGVFCAPGPCGWDRVAVALLGTRPWPVDSMSEESQGLGRVGLPE